MLHAEIERLFDENPSHYTEAQRSLFQQFKDALNSGQFRAAEPAQLLKPAGA